MAPASRTHVWRRENVLHSRRRKLYRDLAPYLLLLIIDPTKANNHGQDRNPSIGRRNIELILNGDSDAVPLFK